MIKKSLLLLLTLTMVISFSMGAFAATTADEDAVSSNVDKIAETISYEDGTYAVVETVIDNNSLKTNGSSAIAATSKNASKTYKYYDSNNNLAWSFTISGTFTYDGSKATASNPSCSSSINVSGWTCTSKSAYCSGASVIGEATFKYGGVPKTIKLTLTCSPSGVIS